MLRLKDRCLRGHTFTHGGADTMAPAYAVHYRSPISGTRMAWGGYPASRMTALGVLDALEFLHGPCIESTCVTVTRV